MGMVYALAKAGRSGSVKGILMAFNSYPADFSFVRSIMAALKTVIRPFEYLKFTVFF